MLLYVTNFRRLAYEDWKYRRMEETKIYIKGDVAKRITDSWNYCYWGKKFELGKESTRGKALCLVVKCGVDLYKRNRIKSHEGVMRCIRKTEILKVTKITFWKTETKLWDMSWSITWKRYLNTVCQITKLRLNDIRRRISLEDMTENRALVSEWGGEEE
jgi:hypothetical protein